METPEEKKLNIRLANRKDLGAVDKLLCQVLELHHKGRPDLFKTDTKKYTDEQLMHMLEEHENRPILVAEDTSGNLLGYAFCIFQVHPHDNILTDIKTLYIDDLCVDETTRGKHVGATLYHAVLDFARKNGCYNVTLNVWTCNESAMRFYERMGLKAQKIGMEQIL